MFNVRTLSLILAVIMVFGVASLAFAQTATPTETPTTAAAGAATMAATAAAGAAATATRAPGTLPTTGGTPTTWLLPLVAFVVLFLVAGLGMNLARRAR